MSTILYESDYALLTFFKNDNLLLLEWKKNCLPNEYINVFSKSMTIASQNKVFYFVSDMRREGVISIENLKWLKKTVIPKSIELGIKKIALILNEGLFSKIYADAICLALEKSRIKLNYFFKPDEAMAWIKSEKS